MYTEPLQTFAFGTDASFYRLTPKIVVKANDAEEVSYILAECDKASIPVTFRAAGTSLSGQAITDSVLVVAGNAWKQHQVLDNGNKIRLQPGVIGAHANNILKPYLRKIGPDPASINSAMIGGIAANNASGMCCGTAQNSYKTVDSMKVIIKDGTMLDTGDVESRKAFEKSHGDLLNELKQLSVDVKNNKALSHRITEKFKMKNTTGYSLNALVDFDDPFDILEHVMIGSEGTLGFIAEITYQTVEEHQHKASALITFPNIEDACRAVILLKSEPVQAVELMDRVSLRSMENADGVPVYLKDLSENASSLLVQTASNDKETLNLQIDQIHKAIKDIPTEIPIGFTDDPSEYAKLWKVRKGLFPTVGAMRKTGTSVIIEDVCFPVPSLAEAIPALQALFAKYDYHQAVIFGHALEGNVHFVFSQDFNNEKEVERYKAFMDDLAKLVVDRFDGALKAEHGTGRNMAPFVEKEWGSEAYALMIRLKAIFDPDNMLNPGVILNNDPELHLKNLKPMPAAHETVDMCTECGFCEPACVSHDLTLSPRQRITVYREMMRLKETGETPEVLASMEKAFDYQSLDTCATDGLCGIACPLDINTGEFVKDLRRQKNTPMQNKIASVMAPRMATTTRATKIALNTSNLFHSLLGPKALGAIAGGLRKVSGNRIPSWNKYVPKAAPKVHPEKYAIKDSEAGKVVYFPSCINQTMGTSKGDEENVPLTTKVKQLIHKSGYEIIYPKNLSGHCCGMPFSSKGFKEQGKEISDRLEQALYEASDGGRYPIVCDMSSCQLTMVENMEPRLKVYGPVEFTLKYLAPKLDFKPIDEPISVFAVCSIKKLGMDSKLEELANLCAKSVTIPETNCCGFAGDRGFSHPELLEHGLRNLNEQIPKEVKNGYCTNRTCEIGLSTHSDITYTSILYLVDRVTTARGKRV